MTHFAVNVVITIALLLPLPLQASFRIVNGNPVSGSEFPWMVSIRRNHQSFPSSISQCGGSLIANDPVIILTAAHCFEKIQQNADGVINHVYVDKNGTTQYLETDVNFDIGRTYPNKYNSSDIYYTLPLTNVSTQVYKPPQWDLGKNYLGFDIALVIFKNDSLTQILEIPNVIDQLEDDNVCCSNNEKLDFIGYGRNQTGGSAAEQLEETHFKYINTTACVKMFVDYTYQLHEGQYPEDELYEFYAQQGNNIICILGNNTDSCNGDGGGPLFRLVENEIQIVGLDSYHDFGCNTEGGAVPSSFTSVGHYKDWIDKVINAVVYGITVEPTSSPTIESSQPTGSPTTEPTAEPTASTTIEHVDNANHLYIIKAIVSTLLIVMWS